MSFHAPPAPAVAGTRFPLCNQLALAPIAVGCQPKTWPGRVERPEDPAAIRERPAPVARESSALRPALTGQPRRSATRRLCVQARVPGDCARWPIAAPLVARHSRTGIAPARFGAARLPPDRRF